MYMNKISAKRETKKPNIKNLKNTVTNWKKLRRQQTGSSRERMSKVEDR